MRTFSAFARLARDAGSLWWQRAAALIGWFSLGYGINELTGHVSTLLVGQRLLGTTVIVLGIVGWVGCLVLAIHGLGSGRWGVLPPEQGRLAVLAAALGPFMAVYGAWGLAEEQFERLIQANLMTHGIDADQFSVNAGDWQFFLGFASVAWLVRLAVRLLTDRLEWRSLVFTGLVADGAWVFASFFVLREWAGRTFDWLSGRAVWRWLQWCWDAFVDVLPAVPVWFQITLPEALRLLAADFWDFVVPGFGNAVLLPLMWVALVGTVFGRRTFDTAQLLGGTRIEVPAARLLQAGRGSPVRRLADMATGELRQKYLPLLVTLRLLRHSGVRLIGSFLVLSAVVQLAGDLFDRGLQFLIGPRPLPETLLYAPLSNYLVGMVTTTMLLACYVAAYQWSVRVLPGTGQARSSIERGGVENRR